MSSLNVDEKLVKKAGDKNDVDLTEEQVEEWLKCAADKYYFFRNYVYIQSEKGRMLFDPREYQSRIIDSCSDNKFVVALMGRQSGKCSGKDTKYRMRNKLTGEIHEFTAEEFHRHISNNTKDRCIDE